MEISALFLYSLKISILDSAGAIVVEYIYDAWGNHKVSGRKASTIGSLNPFRYRSYFYDTETGLYYLQTRYYDPAVGRFLNMDSVRYADPESINGLNLYAYCNNNPVMNVDPTGEFVSTVLGAIFGFAWRAIKEYIYARC
ncbi:MAG: RHS repeat-associated core domain-containing protein [Clostridia bacterium]|nr:RHS repeat-associated core domain-containing protein [Clostridia bacterium]